MSDSNRPIFSIGAVARMLDLPAATLRTWESRYRLVVPQRSAGGQRLYTRGQVEQLRFLKDAVGSGSRPGEAHRLLAERLAEQGPQRRATKVRMVLGEPAALANVLLRQLLERGGFEVADDARLVIVNVADESGAALSGRLQEDGCRVLALVEPGARAPAADAVLRLPVAPRELLAAARRLASA